MITFIILILTIITMLLVLRKFFYSAKANLFRDQASWSGKDIKIKYPNSFSESKSSENDNYLKKIANESKSYLEEEYNQDD